MISLHFIILLFLLLVGAQGEADDADLEDHYETGNGTDFENWLEWAGTNWVVTERIKNLTDWPKDSYSAESEEDLTTEDYSYEEVVASITGTNSTVTNLTANATRESEKHQELELSSSEEGVTPIDAERVRSLAGITPEFHHHEIPFGHDICTLRPLDFGIYYGLNLVKDALVVDYNWARRCCLSRNLKIATIPTDTPWKKAAKLKFLQDAVIAAPYRVDPIGRSQPLFIALDGGKGYDENECPTVHIDSPANATLALTTGNCSKAYRYLCEDPTPVPDCSKIKYIRVGTLMNLRYSKIKLPWIYAFYCCEAMGKELARLSPKEISHVTETFTKKKYTGPSSMFWTGAHQKLETEPFRWGTYEEVRDRSFMKDINDPCGAAVVDDSKKLTFKDHRCEDRLHYMCGSEPRPRCDNSTERFKIEIPQTTREYRYFPGIRMTWGQAYRCCKAIGMRLLTIISPTEGNYLSGSLQANKTLNLRHQGSTNGLWIGARLINGRYSFLHLEGKPNYTFSVHYPRFIRGGQKAYCLSFVIDARASYALYGTPCAVRRSVICETQFYPVDVIPNKLVDVGNRYYFSNRKSHHYAASWSCKSHGMVLFEKKGPEEMRVLLLGVQQYVKPQSYNAPGEDPSKFVGIWTGPRWYRVPVRTYTYLTKFVRGDKKILKDLYRGYYKDENANKWCFVAKMTNSTHIFQTRTKCRQEYRYLCEYRADKDPEVCHGIFKNITGYITRNTLFVSQRPANWFKARRCCRQYRGFELFALTEGELDKRDLKILTAHRFMYPNAGFWTSGSNYGIKERLAWYSTTWEFLHNPKIFYHGYMTPDEPLEEENQCLEAFYHQPDDKYYVSHDDCFKEKYYVCKLDMLRVHIPTCEELVFRRLGNTSYYMSTETMPWPRAVECCMERKSVLARITNNTMNFYLNRYIRNIFGDIADEDVHGIWIGLAKNLATTNYRWIDGKEEFNAEKEFHNFLYEGSLNFTMFRDESHKDCVGVTTDPETFGELKWRNFPCHQFQRALCYFHYNVKGYDAAEYGLRWE